MTNNSCECLNNEAQLESNLNNILELQNNLDSEPEMQSNLGMVVETSQDGIIQRYASKSEFPNVGKERYLYIALDENANYIWKDNKYVCIGRDYTEIEQINGGGA